MYTEAMRDVKELNVVLLVRQGKYKILLFCDSCGIKYIKIREYCIICNRVRETVLLTEPPKAAGNSNGSAREL